MFFKVPKLLYLARLDDKLLKYIDMSVARIIFQIYFGKILLKVLEQFIRTRWPCYVCSRNSPEMEPLMYRIFTFHEPLHSYFNS